MKLLALLFAFCFNFVENLAALDDPIEVQLRDYNSQYAILQRLLAAECPEYINVKREESSLPSVQLQNRKKQVYELQKKLINCQKQKVSTSSALISSTTTHAPLCPHSEGDNQLHIQFVSYRNPTNRRDSGVQCNVDGSPCNVFFEICVSPITSSRCEFSYKVTFVIGENSDNSLIGHLGKEMNPLRVNLRQQSWQGVHVDIMVLDEDLENSQRGFHRVDEFSYNITEEPGSSKNVTYAGLRAVDKTELTVQFTVTCPLPSQKTTPQPITSPPLSTPAECKTATNFTQSWRRDHEGNDLRGGEQLNYACDLNRTQSWFRFSGDAGSRMLNTCPKEKSCGASFALWSDAAHPEVVGVTADLKVNAAHGGDCVSQVHLVQVMKCSESTNDFIYQYVDTPLYACTQAFCGMK